MVDQPPVGKIEASFDVSASGIKGSYSGHIRSRFLTSIDTLFGNITELLNIPIEHAIANLNQRRLSAAPGTNDSSHISLAFENASYAYSRHKAAQEIENVVAVTRVCIDELNSSSSISDDVESGSSRLDADFLARFRRYAEDAGTAEMQLVWGRVLAGEIRRPGTFTRIAMRILDEVDPDVAFMFNDFCKFRTENVILNIFSNETSYPSILRMTSAGLIHPVSTPTHRRFILSNYDGPVSLLKGKNIWAAGFSEYQYIFEESANWRQSRGFTEIDGCPALKAFTLTDVGNAIGRFIELDRDHVHNRISAAIAKALNGEFVYIFRKQQGRSDYIHRIRLSDTEAQ